MVKPKLLGTEREASTPILKTKTFFSTLESTAVPNAATDFFVPLVQQLQMEWNNVYKAADQHLSSMVQMAFGLRNVG